MTVESTMPPRDEAEEERDSQAPVESTMPPRDEAEEERDNQAPVESTMPPRDEAEEERDIDYACEAGEERADQYYSRACDEQA